MVFELVELEGTDSHSFGEQLRAMDDFMVDNWSVAPSKTSGNPVYKTPAAMIIYRKDQKFALDRVIPRPDDHVADYDLIVASQPWRSRTGADFKVSKILCPLSNSLRPSGVLLGIQSKGEDPGVEVVRRIWPDEDPFPVDRHELLKVLHSELGDNVRNFDLMALPESESTLIYEMHTLPTEIGNHIGTSTLFAAWNAAIYVAQIEDQRVEQAAREGSYIEATAEVLQQRGGLWFNDETFVVRRT